MASSLMIPGVALPRLSASVRTRRRVAVRRAPSCVASSEKAGQQGRARDVSAFAAGEGSAGQRPGSGADYARVAAAVRLAAALYSPALVDSRGAARRARAFPRRSLGKGAFENGSAAGPSHGRLAETLSARAAPAPAAPFPGGWWGKGTYTDAQLRGDGASARALGRGDGDRPHLSVGLEEMAAFEMPPPARGRLVATRATASAASSTSGDDADDAENADVEQRPNLLEQIWLRLVKPLRDFGFGRTNIWEGGVGLFLLGGLSIAALAVNWVMGVNFNKMRSYQAFVEFPFACGIQVGTQVRVRGVKVGNVLSVRPNLERVEVLVEMDDDGIVIPRNSLVEANQSGLIAETIIDITPEVPIPDAQWGPLDSGCEGEGLVVCDRGKIVGVPGVSMDELVGICTKLAREMDAQKGLAKMFATAETAQDLMKNLEPLLLEAAEIAKELRPMLQNVQEQGTLDTIELLAGHATNAVTDIRELKRTILTDENQEMLRQSITIMTKTLQHMEKVSGDISSVSGDPATRQNLRHLIQCLSRLVDK